MYGREATLKALNTMYHEGLIKPAQVLDMVDIITNWTMSR